MGVGRGAASPLFKVFVFLVEIFLLSRGLLVSGGVCGSGDPVTPPFVGVLLGRWGRSGKVFSVSWFGGRMARQIGDPIDDLGTVCPSLGGLASQGNSLHAPLGRSDTP